MGYLGLQLHNLGFYRGAGGGKDTRCIGCTQLNFNWKFFCAHLHALPCAPCLAYECEPCQGLCCL